MSGYSEEFLRSDNGGNACVVNEWAWYQDAKAKLGKADWRWDDELQMHLPCCSRPKGTWRCGNGPLVGDAILTGDCGEHPPITPTCTCALNPALMGHAEKCPMRTPITPTSSEER